MSKRPGRKNQSGAYRKKQLSSDARIIYALHKNKLQSKEELIKNSRVTLKTFYRITSFLLEKQIIKRVDRMYAFKEYTPLRKRIEEALTNPSTGKYFANQSSVENDVGKPWREIESLTREIAKELGLTAENINGETHFFRAASSKKQ